MGPRFLITMCALVLLGAASASIAGQTAKPWTPPKTPWGDPDIQGLWPADKLNGVPLQRAQNLGTRNILTDEEFAQRTAQAARQEEIDNAEFVTTEPLIASGNGFLTCAQDAQRCRNGVRIGPPNYWDERGKPNRQASLVVDPPNGRIPAITPEAQKLTTERNALRPQRPCTRSEAGCADSYDDFSLWERCISRGVTSLWPGGYNKGNQILQAPGVVVIRNEMIHENRIVWLDGREQPPKNVTSYMGYSRGHWEGNTLVVETTNLNNSTTVGNAAPSDAFVMTERFTRVNEKTLRYEATITDPKTWTAPWTVAFPLELDPAYDIYEYACHEANYAMFNRLTGARATEKAETEKSK